MSTLTQQLPRVPDYAFYAFGMAIFVVCNTALFAKGWVSQFNQEFQKSPVTGYYLLDMVSGFFCDAYQSPAARVLMDTFLAFVAVSSTSIVYSTSRRRSDAKFPQWKAAAYLWTIASTSAAFATSVMYGFLLRNKSQSSSTDEDIKKLDFVGRKTILAVVFNSIALVGLGYKLHATQENEQEFAKYVMALAVAPPAIISAAVMLDRRAPCEKTPGALQYLPYFLGFVKGTIAHLSLVALLVRQGPSSLMNDIGSNPAAMYVLVDLLGAIAATYMFVHSEQHVPPLKNWGVILACGPVAHFSWLAWECERTVDSKIESMEGQNEGRSGIKQQQQQSNPAATSTTNPQQQQQQHSTKPHTSTTSMTHQKDSTTTGNKSSGITGGISGMMNESGLGSSGLGSSSSASPQTSTTASSSMDKDKDKEKDRLHTPSTVTAVPGSG